uniref:tRNA-intron lyase n=1 Tax=Kalanchoe fedtschenkoi TaxID=63787 RepID=A0A7N0TA86_KALFE
MAPRWKGRGCEAKALVDPMSMIIHQLQRSLSESNSCGLLSGHSVLLEVTAEQIQVLNRSCFGRPVITAEKNTLWFQLGLEEAFYLCHSLNCLTVKDSNDGPVSPPELWNYAVSVKPEFPILYKAYSHLRAKNWVVRPGSQYGVDFVAYRHHPALVHSEYAVLALLHGDDESSESNGRLRVWSDILCTVRLCGSVAKTLLVIYINRNGHDPSSPGCLDGYTVQERTIRRWNPEQCREGEGQPLPQPRPQLSAENAST